MGLLMAAFYLVCVLAIVFHFANGLWTAGITWGLTLSTGAMRRWGQACAGIGLTLALAGVMAVYGFSTLDVAEAKRVEGAMHTESMP
jgi:succinate dehydrogenase / fumarate reductase cytochrome b subunit